MKRFAALIALVTIVPACNMGDDSVFASGVSTNKATHALSSGALLWANGTYGSGCTNRSGSWSLAIDGYADAMDHAALSVVKDNTACVLTLTELVASAGYAADPTFAMGTDFQASASAFSHDGGPLAFYANAKMSSVSFASVFTVSIVYSDDPNLANGSNNSSYATVSSSASSQGVPPPNYTIDMTGIQIQVDDAESVQSVSGNAQLNLADGEQAGQEYLEVDSLADTSFATVDTAFTSGSPITMTDGLIGNAAFHISGTLPLTRYLIISNTDSATGVVSYEVITVTFNAP